MNINSQLASLFLIKTKQDFISCLKEQYKNADQVSNYFTRRLITSFLDLADWAEYKKERLTIDSSFNPQD